MFRFEIDITPTINGKECHLEGYCETPSKDIPDFNFNLIKILPELGLKLTEDNFKKALQYNIEYFIPKYENPEVCKRCKFFNTNQKRKRDVK